MLEPALAPLMLLMQLSSLNLLASISVVSSFFMPDKLFCLPKNGLQESLESDTETRELL